MAILKDYYLVLSSILLSTCQGANTTFKWNSVSPSSTAPVTHGNVGDYVAAGLGITTHETSSTVEASTAIEEHTVEDFTISAGENNPTTAVKDSDSTSQNSGSSSSSTSNNETAIHDTAGFVASASGFVQATTNTTNATVATGCWQSWLDYWSESSLNQGSYTTSFYAPSTVTKTELAVSITTFPTSSWTSYIHTYTQSTLSTILSDGYPVSVAVSYSVSTYSNVGWTTITIWSSLNTYMTTYTETWSWYSDITPTRSITELPTPKCKLPAVEPACSEQWSSYIMDTSQWRYYDTLSDPSHGSFPGTPDCTQVMITGDWCTSMASFYFARETMYGQGTDVGWLTENSTTYFPASRSLAPGCSLGCQACSITGESVQLYYWPPSTASLVENGTETATLTPFAANASGIRTALVDGEYSTMT